MFAWTIEQAFPFTHQADVEIALADGEPEDLAKVDLTPFPCRPQEGTDLGNRMQRAFSIARSEGFQRTVIIGTDAPRLDLSVLRQAFDSLDRCEVVLGPAWDGGYYLIGLRQPIPELFDSIPWGTSTVLDDTLKRAHAMNLSVALLSPLPDIDRAEDLPLWCLSHGPILPVDLGSVSVIIPTLNESQTIAQTVTPLLRQPNIEVIVVDGKSQDNTAAIVRQLGLSVLTCQEGRGAQINLGASVARGEYLLFLHADTTLPTDFVDRVRQQLARPNVTAGAFSFDVDDRSQVPRLIRWGTNVRSRWLGLPFGDQAIFTRAETFWQVGGAPHWPILDDVELVRRLRRTGKMVIDPAAAVTSARRWRKLGPWRTWWINQLVLAGYAVGFSPERLADFYRSQSPKAPALPSSS
jgi:rSAM/selenodomain-associated transferase 2/rSAM/selenodomain-associated transferase 1